MVFSNSWIRPLQVFLISTGVLSIALFCKTSVPFVMDISVVSRASVMWTSFLSWLRPPYLYLIINAIIIIIAASSRLYHNCLVSASSESTPSRLPLDLEKVKSDFASVVFEQLQLQMIVEEEETKASVFEEKSVVVGGGGGGGAEAEVGYGDAPTLKAPKTTDSLEILRECEFSAEKEKPLVSARIGHRKPIKASPEGGKRLRVTKPKRLETLENSWRTITEGRAMPLTRHLKKSDTPENRGRQIDDVDPSPVNKLEKFKVRTNYPLPSVNSTPGSVGKLRKEPSLSQDELNRRVEAFIKKFNDDMRIQRQESLRHYQEMISRGV